MARMGIGLIAAVWVFTGVSLGAPQEQVTRADKISIDGAVKTPKSLTLEDLRHEPGTTEVDALKTGKGSLTGSYMGVLLWTLLQEAVIQVSCDHTNDLIRRTITVTSSDCYAAVLSV